MPQGFFWILLWQSCGNGSPRDFTAVEQVDAGESPFWPLGPRLVPLTRRTLLYDKTELDPTSGQRCLCKIFTVCPKTALGRSQRAD